MKLWVLRTAYEDLRLFEERPKAGGLPRYSYIEEAVEVEISLAKKVPC